jgi:hypothetical protein
MTMHLLDWRFAAVIHQIQKIATANPHNKTLVDWLEKNLINANYT